MPRQILLCKLRVNKSCFSFISELGESRCCLPEACSTVDGSGGGAVAVVFVVVEVVKVAAMVVMAVVKVVAVVAVRGVRARTGAEAVGGGEWMPLPQTAEAVHTETHRVRVCLLAWPSAHLKPAA